MSDTRQFTPIERARVLTVDHESTYILAYLAMRLHDEKHGTHYAEHDGCKKRQSLWQQDGIPWDIMDDTKRTEMLELLLGNDVFTKEVT